MKSVCVIRFAEQDPVIRAEQAVSYPQLEGLTLSKKGEKLVRQVASGTLSAEKALRDLRTFYKTKAETVSRST